MEAAGASPLGQVSHGYMCLTGRLKAAAFSSAVLHNEECDYEEHSKELWGPSGEIVGIIFVDVLSDLQDREEVFCLNVRKDDPRSDAHPPEKYRETCMNGQQTGFLHDMVMGLALVKRADRANTYRRVGLVRWMKAPWFGDEATQLTIT